ncbi:S8 family peptidase [Runella sp.]|uniref:S8 family peptidase n=1 Tax=Runella sp. TaxID=1960881 RepID=UPI003D121919
MKKAKEIKICSLLFLQLFTANPFDLFAQKADTLYVSDEIYVKIKDSQPITKTTGREIETISVNFLRNTLISSLVLKAELPFYFSSNEKLLRTFRIKLKKPENINLIIEEFQKDTTIEYAERISKVYKFDTPDDPLFYHQYFYYDVIQMNQVWEHYKFLPDATAIVAVVDDAVQIYHNDLVANIYDSHDVADNDNDASPPSANFSHGTHVAGILGAITDNGIGVASIGSNVVKIMAVKASYDTYTGFIDRSYEGIAWAAEHGAKIINCSWGSSEIDQTEQIMVIGLIFQHRDMLFIVLYHLIHMPVTTEPQWHHRW